MIRRTEFNRISQAVFSLSCLQDALMHLLGVSFQERRIYVPNYQRSSSQKRLVKSSLLTCPC